MLTVPDGDDWKQSWNDNFTNENPLGKDKITKFIELRDVEEVETLKEEMIKIGVHFSDEMTKWLAQTRVNISKCDFGAQEPPNCRAFWKPPVSQGIGVMDFRAPKSFVKKFIERDMGKTQHLHPLIHGNAFITIVFNLWQHFF